MRWQLYYHSGGNRDDAFRLFRTGVRVALQSNALNPQDECTLYDLTDELTDWRCLRLESPTNAELAFKSLMKAIVLANGNLGIVTVQPANVDLFSAKADETTYQGSIENMHQRFGDESDATSEI
jgi:hypothetical protein